ncbi:pentraxin-4 [Spea bombifrons]|uniref:pentraxin-4 n=1 Tax=Spea bombifrons TaxID=233779 RepID=UPI00234B1025|nr:pentraxin-4 [Spea bombifrons]
MLRLLVLAALCLPGVLPEQSRILEQRKPFFERFRRLEEQFRRFQEVMLTRLQGIAENYNISYNIDRRFEHILDQQRSLTEAFNASSDVTQGEMNAIKIWLKKMQKKTKKLDLKMSSLEESMTERNKQMTRDSKARDAVISNLTLAINSQKLRLDKLVKDKSVLHKGMEMFREVVKRQGGKIAALEEQVRGLSQNDILPPSPLMAAQELNRTPQTKQSAPPGFAPGTVTVEQRMVKLQTKHDQRKKFHEEQQLLIPKSIQDKMAAQHGNGTKIVVSPKDKPPGRPPLGVAEDNTLGRDATKLPPRSAEEKISHIRTTFQPPGERKMPDILTTAQPPRVTEKKSSSVHSMSPPPRVTDQKTFAVGSTRFPPRIMEEKATAIGTTKPQPRIMEEKAPGVRSTTASAKVPMPTEPRTTKVPGTICNVDSMLTFPSPSTENFATFKSGLREGLHEFSICSWVKTNASYVGTILSYATEDNDNKLVLHGRNGAAYDSLHFVIGDPAFRELPIVPLIDGNWHHTCFIWSSIQGKYWFYVDRRLASTGSRFQKGYEIPPGGSLVLGQEQDTLGGGFDSSEAFVGHLAGFTMWKRALTPGEVSGIATGRGLPRGAILTLADASSLHGSVQRVKCTCLEHCL